MRGGRRAHWLALVGAALDRYPDLGRFDRTKLLRAIVLDDARNRLILRLRPFPKLTQLAARLVPIAGNVKLVASVAPERPVIFALMHFGPIYFSIAVAMRLFGGRRVYVIHAGGESGEAVASYFARIGIVPIVSDPGALSRVEDAIANGGPSLVLYCFDHPQGRRRRRVPFLGGTLAAPTGIGYLTEVTNATVITAWWERRALGSRLRIGDAYEIDRALATPQDRQNAMTDILFGVLEALVRAMPEHWTEWGEPLDG